MKPFPFFIVPVLAGFIGCATPYQTIAKSPKQFGWYAEKQTPDKFRVIKKSKYFESFLLYQGNTWDAIQKIRLSTYLNACEIVKREGFDSFLVIDESNGYESIGGGELTLRVVTLVGIVFPYYDTLTVSLIIQPFSSNGATGEKDWRVVNVDEFKKRHSVGSMWNLSLNEPLSFPSSTWVDFNNSLNRTDGNVSYLFASSINVSLLKIDLETLNHKENTLPISLGMSWVTLPSGHHSFTAKSTEGDFVLAPRMIYELAIKNISGDFQLKEAGKVSDFPWASNKENNRVGGEGRR